MYFFGSYKQQGTVIQKTLSPNDQLSPVEWGESLLTNIKIACIDEEKIYIGGSNGIFRYPLLQDGSFDINKGFSVLPTYRMHNLKPDSGYIFTVHKEILYLTLNNQIFSYKMRPQGGNGLDVSSQEFIQLPENFLNKSPTQILFWKERLLITYPSEILSIDLSKPQIDFHVAKFENDPIFTCCTQKIFLLSSPKKIEFHFNTLNLESISNLKNPEGENRFLKKILSFFCFYENREKKLTGIQDLGKYYEL